MSSAIEATEPTAETTLLDSGLVETPGDPKSSGNDREVQEYLRRIDAATVYRPVYTEYPRESRRRFVSPSPNRERIREEKLFEPLKVLTNTTELNELLQKTDATVETHKGRVYMTNHDFHQEEVQKLSWLFVLGKSDDWIQKPTYFHDTGNGIRVEMSSKINRDRYERYDERYDRTELPIARLGCALRIFKDDTATYSTSKVKFITAVQSKIESGLFKLMTSYSRQAAAADILYEILNGNSILFVGAVLKDVSIPGEFVQKNTKVRFQRVGSLVEAEDVTDAMVAIIC
jgi:hypothetical protein